MARSSRTPIEPLSSGGGTSAFNIAGGVGQNEYNIDGAPNAGSNRRVALIAPTDAVGQLRLETSNFDASFGHTSRATIHLSTKSGTNNLHLGRRILPCR